MSSLKEHFHKMSSRKKSGSPLTKKMNSNIQDNEHFILYYVQVDNIMNNLSLMPF